MGLRAFLINNKIKLYVILAFLSLLIVGGGIIYLQNRKIVKQEAQIESQNDYINTCMSDISILTLNKKELKEYLKTSRDSTAIILDSIMKLKKVGVKDLLSFVRIGTEYSNKDTNVVVNKPSLLRPELKMTFFEDIDECTEFKGYVISTDSIPTVVIYERKAKNETDIIKYKEPRKFFDYVLFWKLFKKRKVITEKVNKCGNSIYREVINE